MKHRAGQWSKLSIILGLVLLAAMPLQALAASSNPGVLPPNASPNGLTYGEWAARWWEWALLQPTPVNPLLDATGQFCGQGQSGQVWFLVGTFGGNADRICTVPAGTKLFFPIANYAYIGWTTLPSDTPQFALASVKDWADNTLPTMTLSAQIDGVPVQNLDRYFTFSPVFYPRFPTDNVAGITAAECPADADGYFFCGPPSGSADAGVYLMLAPLPPGEHVIQFSWSGNTVTYHLTVGRR